jgi:hypothetical protein
MTSLSAKRCSQMSVMQELCCVTVRASLRAPFRWHTDKVSTAVESGMLRGCCRSPTKPVASALQRSSGHLLVVAPKAGFRRTCQGAAIRSASGFVSDKDRELRRQGLSLREIARRCRISKTSVIRRICVYKEARQRGLRMPGQSPGREPHVRRGNDIEIEAILFAFHPHGVDHLALFCRPGAGHIRAGPAFGFDPTSLSWCSQSGFALLQDRDDLLFTVACPSLRFSSPRFGRTHILGGPVFGG